jgi:hypothetical protein
MYWLIPFRLSNDPYKLTSFLVAFSIAISVIMLAACQAVQPPINPTAVSSFSATITASTPGNTLQATQVIAIPVTNDTPSPSETTGVLQSPTIGATLTAWPTRVFTPTRGPSPTRTATITNTPTITPTPLPPLAVLRFTHPGPFSKIVSPIKIEAMVSPGDDGYVYFDLIGEDNRIISHNQVDLRRNLGQHLIISPRIDFQISAAAETTRLVMYTVDQANRIVDLTSLDLILLSLGNSGINPPYPQQEPYAVRYPHPGDSISGGILHIVGLSRPVNSRPLIFELVDENQKVVGSTEALIAQPTGDLSHTPFEINIPYVITGPTSVRLTLRQESDSRIPGTVALYSFKLDLQP